MAKTYGSISFKKSYKDNIAFYDLIMETAIRNNAETGQNFIEASNPVVCFHLYVPGRSLIRVPFLKKERRSYKMRLKCMVDGRVVTKLSNF